MSLQIVKCEATPDSIMVFFSGVPMAGSSVEDPARYKLTAPKSGIPNPTQLPAAQKITYDSLFSVAVIALGPRGLKYGDDITITFTDGVTPLTKTAQVNGTGQASEPGRDAVAYPLLTENVSFPGGGGASIAAPQSSGTLSQTAVAALNDVLGWKVNASDAKGFVGALTQSFSLTEVEGHTEATWKPRTYAVQTDLAGGITGAQASLYSLAKTALDQSLPLLDGLYPLDPETELEDAAALRELARSQMMEIVKELGKVGGPSTLRVDTYFQILLGSSATPPKDADSLTGGTLKELRDTFGIGFIGNPFSNSIEDETNITNFRIISDYMSSLLQTWINNKQYFKLGPSNTQAFLGTQLVLISRQFSVIVETVNEVRFTLNSVFIGPSERQTLLLEFEPSDGIDPIFLEDVLLQIESFASDEGPRLIQNGGRLSVTNNVAPVVKTLRHLASKIRKPANRNKLPDGFRTIRVKNALDDLHDQLRALEDLAGGVGRDLPALEGGLLVFPQELAFDANTQSQTLTIANIGNSKLTQVTLSFNQANFKATPPFIQNLGPTETAVITIYAIPGTFPAQLTIEADEFEPKIVKLTAPVGSAAGPAKGK
jgi:hypothetical protein